MRLVRLALLAPLALILGSPGGALPAVSAPPVAGPALQFNALVDLDHGAAFPRNEQNEPAVTRDPLTGVQVYDAYFVERATGAATCTAPLRVSSASSNPDGSSHNTLQEQFIGDYLGIVAGPSAAYVVWTDSRNATPCAAVDAHRSQVYAGSKRAVAPNPDKMCAIGSGNTAAMAPAVRY